VGRILSYRRRPRGVTRLLVLIGAGLLSLAWLLALDYLGALR
jgi:hypothetical protein